MKKEKYCQIFNYLKEFSKLRDNPVRDIEAHESQYPELLWLSEIPECELFENIIRENFNHNNDYWVRISKPREPQKPVFAKLQGELDQWVEKESLYTPGIEPHLIKVGIFDGIEIRIQEKPQVIRDFDEYISKKWQFDLSEYNEKLAKYKEDIDKFERYNSVYKKIFRINNKAKQFGEEYELIIGIGLLNFKENNDRPKIFRHFFTQRVDIQDEYSINSSLITISPNLESKILIETDSIIDLEEQFDIQNIIDSEKYTQSYLQDSEIEFLFDGICDAVQLFADKLSPESYFRNSIEKPIQNSTRPEFVLAPALILRKRNTKKFTALYEKILSDIENSSEDLNISSINDLIGYEKVGSELNNECASKNCETIYFPKEFNDEQIEIIEQTRMNNKVLVQGPPGTGKSHTIANIICHLLANGKKILVTAYTKRALEVLKDKIPTEFQDLTVNLLSGDTSSIQDLQSSVNSINEELSRGDRSIYEAHIKKYEQDLQYTREQIAEDTNKLYVIQEKATRNIEINSKYNGTLLEIAEKLQTDANENYWYKDDYCDINNPNLENDIAQYINERNYYLGCNTAELEMSFPELAELPDVDVLRRLAELKSKIESYNLIETLSVVSKNRDIETLFGKIKELLDCSNRMRNVNNLAYRKIKDSSANKQLYLYEKSVQKAHELLNSLQRYNLNIIDKDYEIQYPADKSIKQIKRDVQILLDFIKSGNTLTGINFRLRKRFLPDKIKERLYILKEIEVNGGACNSIEEFEIVLRDIEIKQDISLIVEYLEVENIPVVSYQAKITYLRQFFEDILTLIDLYKEAIIIKADVSDNSNIILDIFNNDEIEKYCNAVEISLMTSKIKACEETVSIATEKLKSRDFGKIGAQLVSALDSININAYQLCISELNEMSVSQNAYRGFLNLQEKIKQLLPDLYRQIQENHFSKQDFGKFRNALLFTHATKEISAFIGDGIEEQLIEEIKLLESKEKKLIAKLASSKAWQHISNDLQGNSELRKHLNAWVLAVKRIGKTGKGKTALKFQKLAQIEMDFCKNAVPCWIMPLYKVAETIKPEQGMFDYVIIDEASQLGPDAIFLLYISKKIIIVGDDKQTSPEYIGTKPESIYPFIKKHLGAIPFADYYGTEFSFFDHAKLFCNGMTVLREHFRCMPEIIEFSNKHFYAPEGKGLYPLRQYSEDRLDPLVSVFCSNGYTEGKDSRIVNIPEANLIADSIENFIKQPEYDEKTIGVIALQGQAQARVIEDLLLKKIGEKEFRKRKIVCGNSSSFQGDERDVMILSLVTANNHNRSAFVKRDDERRFNVAISRAKDQVWLFHSIRIDDISNKEDLRYKLLDHFKNANAKKKFQNSPIVKSSSVLPSPFESWFEVDVYNDIVKKGINVIPQYEVANGKFRIDMVAIFSDGKKVAIECDGDRWHGPEQFQNDIMRQKVLERCGWQFFRVRGYEYYSNRTKALERLWSMIPYIESEDETNNEDETEQIINNISDTKVEYDDYAIETETPIIPLACENPIKQSISSISISEENGEAILKYFTLSQDGSYILTEEFQSNAAYSIPLKVNHRKGYLLQCYKSGHVNKVNIQTILKKKLNKQFLNGLNKDDNLIFAEVIPNDAILGIIFKEDGRTKFKAHLTEDISNRDQLNLQGYKVIYNDFSEIMYTIIPYDTYDKIKRLVFQSFTAGGKAVDNNYYSSEWEIIGKFVSLNSFNSGNENLEYKNDNGNSNDFNAENEITTLEKNVGRLCVKIHSVVKIRYLRNDKILLIRIVGYQPAHEEKINGLVSVYFKNPLAQAILGKEIGEVGFVERVGTAVEIVDIDWPML